MALIRVYFGGELERECPLTKDVTILGRQEDSDIHIDNLGISRHHARIRKDGGTFVVEDLGSSNGTFVNGESIETHTLGDQDKINIGKYSLVFVATAGAGSATISQEADQGSVSAASFGDSSLNTMAMDGNALRKRIEEMHSEKQAQANGTGAPAAASSADSAAELRAREAELAMMKQSMQKVKIIVGVVVAVVLAVIAAVVFL